MFVLLVLDSNSVGGGNAGGFLEEPVMDKAQMRAVNIGLEADIQNRLRQVVTDIDGKFLPLLRTDIRRETVGNPGPGQKPVQGFRLRCFFRRIFITENQPFGTCFIIYMIARPGGLDVHKGIEKMVLPDQFCQYLLAVNAVERTDNHSMRGRHQLHAVQDLAEAVVFGRDQDQIRPRRLLRCTDIWKDLFSVDHKPFFAQPLRPFSLCDNTEVISKCISESSYKKCADCTCTDQRNCPEFHIFFLPTFRFPMFPTPFSGQSAFYTCLNGLTGAEHFYMLSTLLYHSVKPFATSSWMKMRG